jgi:AcrR family transcriptional regulator
VAGDLVICIIRHVSKTVCDERDERVVTASERGGDPLALPRREHILKAARAVIDEFGCDALTSQIAERAGLARPNVYRHFSSRDDLDLAVARDAYQELRAEVGARLELCGRPREAIRAPIAAQVTWADNHPNLYRFIIGRGYQWTSQQRQVEHIAFAAEITKAAARYLPHFAANPDAADTLCTAIGGLIDASILHWLHLRTDTREQLIDRLTSYTWLIIDDYLRELGVRGNPTVRLTQIDSRKAEPTKLRAQSESGARVSARLDPQLQ